MKLNKVYKHRQDLQWKKIEDEVVLIDDAEGKVFRFDAVASEIWTQLNGLKTLPEIVQSLTETFDVTPQQAEKDVQSFLSRLSCLDLIQKVEE